ncbi:VPS18, CORVET/HOPS core subunit S homeolog isoform X1 [Xenopus laevis]|uniref:Vacuolar protein sorting-associated protein 18 homolog n=1 Tax=Xenopus laevis TaxID=8355 RepID=A0A8J1LLN8_XENLA|nr:VPS18, CORVET/HOPS core subunit S homeolog isoform X1 [Xenopus laevis]
MQHFHGTSTDYLCYVNARLEKETPIFNKQRIDFSPPENINSLVVCSNQLCMSLGKDSILRIDLMKADQPNQVDLGRKDDFKVHRIFLDPTGSHLLIALNTSECLYLNRNAQKVRVLSRWRGHLVESIGWNKLLGNETSTGPILVGTAQGLIFEADISASEGGLFSTNPDQYFRNIHTLEEETGPAPVCCLEINRGYENRFSVIATTPKRLFQFAAKIPEGTEQQGFTPLFNQPVDDLPSIQEFPGTLGYSEIAFYTQKLRSIPSSFAWMMGNGVLYGNLDFSRPDSILTDVQVWEYPSSAEKPMSIVLTQFHFLLLLPDRIKAICILNGQVVFEDIFTEKFGPLKKMLKDPNIGQIWIHTERAVFRYHVEREPRDVWKMYMSMGKFDLAKEFCRDRPECMDTVLANEAEHCFQSKKYIESAKCYALTQKYFEEVALKFIEAKQEEALMEYLQKKLSNLKSSEKIQVTLLTTWLTELYLNHLGILESDASKRSLYLKARDDFKSFLNSPKNKECLFNNRASIHDLLASHGDTDHMVYFAVLMQDYERVVAHHCQHDDYNEALNVLSKYKDEKLFYKFSPVLMQHIPTKVVDAWISMGKKLDPKNLIPALVNYSQSAGTQINEAIRYMEYCVYKMKETEQAIHNYLLSLYAQFRSDSLLSYLEKAGTNTNRIHYDLKYALRLCAEHGHHRACVHVYKVMELYEEAVDLALKVDVDLAKSCADLPVDDEELQKKLWLKIARHVVQEEKDVKKAMACLSSCHLLKIEDILPFFPDFVTIDHFKEAICNSLEDYNKHIEELKREMEDATLSAKRIREDMQEMRNKYGLVDPQDKCTFCDFPLLNRPFYLFLCGHMFHYDCLMQVVVPNLPAYRQVKLEDLQQKLAAAVQPPKSRSQAKEEDTINLAKIQQSREQIKADIDDIVAAECAYCGELMIRSIDKPFIDPQKYKEEMLSWL